MIQGIFSSVAGISGLIIGGTSAVQSAMADGVVSESTGITLGLVAGAVVFVAVGAWRLANYVTTQETRLRRLEEIVCDDEKPEVTHEKRRH